MRRVYLYLVAFVSLLVVAYGAADLARALIESALPGTVQSAGGLRRDVAQNGAYLVVGVPIWLLHWGLASRAARASVDERAATLRRLYLYAVLAAMLIAATSALQNVLEFALRALLGAQAGSSADPTRGVLIQLPWLAIGTVLWLYHRRVVVADRLAAGEAGGGATLRRWYVYGAALIALLLLLGNTADVLREAWETVAGAVTGTTGSAPAYGLAGNIATALVALLAWVPHWSLRAAGPPREAILEQDVRSTLRPVYLFIALTTCVGYTLAGLSQLLYYALGRALGVSSPGGVGGNLLIAMAGPASTALVYGAAWLSVRHFVSRQALAQAELPRQAGVRRLYVYLVALVSLAVLASGAGGLLWTVADLATSAPRAVGSADWWREQVSLYGTLLLVGLPVWTRHWGPASGRVEEAGSLARRIYLYVALGAAVLALLGAGIAAARQVFLLVLGETATASAVTNLARSIAVAAVAGLVIFYHQRVLRRDMAAVVPLPPSAPDTARVAAAGATPSATAPAIGAASGEASPQTAISAPSAILSEAKDRAAPSSQRPCGVLYQLDGTLHADWFATPQEATAALEETRQRQGVEWAATIHL